MAEAFSQLAHHFTSGQNQLHIPSARPSGSQALLEYGGEEGGPAAHTDPQPAGQAWPQTLLRRQELSQTPQSPPSGGWPARTCGERGWFSSADVVECLPQPACSVSVNGPEQQPARPLVPCSSSSGNSFLHCWAQQPCPGGSSKGI